jgi:hypothetical protein
MLSELSRLYVSEEPLHGLDPDWLEALDILMPLDLITSILIGNIQPMNIVTKTSQLTQYHLGLQANQDLTHAKVLQKHTTLITLITSSIVSKMTLHANTH